MEPIKKELLIDAGQETAFNVFTQKMDLWWPKSYHVGSSPMTEAVLEPKADGRWYSIHEDGSEANIGRVSTWNPYTQLVLVWQVNGDYKYDPELFTEVEVNFIRESSTKTRVTLEHRNLDKLSASSKVITDMDEGWSYIMNLYKGVAEA